MAHAEFRADSRHDIYLVGDRRRHVQGLSGSAQLRTRAVARRAARRPKRAKSSAAERATDHAATGKWPTEKSGPISGANETWNAVATAMYAGVRGLRRGYSLPQLLARRRGVRNRKALPHLKESQILTWADHHFGKTGKWPAAGSGVVAEAPGETWMAVEQALTNGLRGLPGGSSIARLLSAGRGVRHRLSPPPLTEQQILAWAKAHYKATGKWPICHGGPISQSPSDTWLGVDKALRAGRRGLPGGSSLTMLLRKHGMPPKTA
jgi:hypothetical protein